MADLTPQKAAAVSARDLHAFLEVGKDFTTWVKVQVQRAGLVEDEDYVIENTSLAENSTRDVVQIWGGQNRRDWFLTLDAAKELRRIEQSSRPALPDFSDPVIAARAWADEVGARRKVWGMTISLKTRHSTPALVLKNLSSRTGMGES